MIDFSTGLRPPSNSSYPISEDEFRKETLNTPLQFCKNSDETSISLDKTQDEKHQNQSILNFIEFHLHSQEELPFAEEKGLKRNHHIRANSCPASKDSSQEFFPHVVLRTKKKIIEFLKFFIWQMAHSSVLRTFKDYYPKELFVEKISGILTKIQETQCFKLENFLLIFKKIRKLWDTIDEDIEVFMFRDHQLINNPYILKAKLNYFLVELQYFLSAILRDLISSENFLLIGERKISKEEIMDNLRRPFSLDIPKFQKSVTMKTQSLMQIFDNSNKSEKIKGNLICRLCLHAIGHDNFKQHSKTCKKQMEKKYLLNVLKKSCCTYFWQLNTIERRLNNNVLLERNNLKKDFKEIYSLKKNSSKTFVDEPARRFNSNDSKDESGLSIASFDSPAIIDKKTWPAKPKKSDFFNFCNAHLISNFEDFSNYNDKTENASTANSGNFPMTQSIPRVDSPIPYKEPHHNFSNDLRLQVLAKRAKPYLQKPNFDELYPKNYNDFTDNSGFLEKNECSFLSLEKEEEGKESRQSQQNITLDQSTHSLHSMEDLRNFSSDGMDKSSNASKNFVRKPAKKNMTLILDTETSKNKTESSDKKRKNKNHTILKVLKEKRRGLKELEQASKAVCKVSAQLKEILQEDYSKVIEIKISHLINDIREIINFFQKRENFKEEISQIQIMIIFLTQIKDIGHKILKHEKECKRISRPSIRTSPNEQGSSKRKEGLGSLDKYKPDERPLSGKPSKFKTNLIPKGSNFSLLKNRKKTSFLDYMPDFSEHKAESFQTMLLNKTGAIKKKLQEELRRTDQKERTPHRKTAPTMLKERRSMPVKGQMILKDIEFENEEESKTEDFDRESNQLKEEVKNSESSNGSSDSMTNLSFISNGKTEEHLKGFYSDSYLHKRTASNSEKIHEKNAVGLNDFEFVSRIGNGAFGRVYLVKRKNVDDFYAMKIVNVIDKLNKTKMEDLKTESKIFDYILSEFVVKAYFKFTYETFICFVMEYMNGGDFGHLLKSEQYFDEKVAKFYISELVLAVEYLHSIGVVHKDLKPENMLLDTSGHLKLTDFGLSDIKIENYKSNQNGINQFLHKQHQALNKYLQFTGGNKLAPISKFAYEFEDKEQKMLSPTKQTKRSLRSTHKFRRFVGTPDYIAPEIIIGTNVKSKGVDWWGIGVILFEFLTGVPPFNDETPDKIFENIINLKIPWDEIELGYEPSQMSPEAADLIKKLLVLDPEQRLGRNSVNEIKNHKFFEGVDWNNLRKTKAPIIPAKFDKESVISNLCLNGCQNLEDPFATVQGNDNEKLKAETYIKTIETFQQTRFDLLYQQNEKMLQD